MIASLAARWQARLGRSRGVHVIPGNSGRRCSSSWCEDSDGSSWSESRPRARLSRRFPSTSGVQSLQQHQVDINRARASLFLPGLCDVADEQSFAEQVDDEMKRFKNVTTTSCLALPLTGLEVYANKFDRMNESVSRFSERSSPPVSLLAAFLISTSSSWGDWRSWKYWQDRVEAAV
eukprot:416353-Hanusia_phi.AAC.1